MFRRRLAIAIAISVFVLIVSVLLGMFAVGAENELGEMVRQQVAEISDQLSRQIQDEEPLMMSILIFLNNLRACLLLFIGGASFGVLTIVILSINGALIGAIIELTLPEKGAFWVAAALIPHGIFEIPAILFASSLGILLGEELWRELHGSGNAAATARRLGMQFVRLVIPLLLIAAIIEAFITPEIVNLMI